MELYGHLAHLQVGRIGSPRVSVAATKTDVQRYPPMISGDRPVNTRQNRRIFGLAGGAGGLRPSATAAAAGALAISARAALVADLGALLGESRLHRRVAGAFEADLEVVGRQVPLGLPPAVGEEVLEPGGGRLPELVRSGNPHV